jgi:hypothetical protein
MNAKTKPTNPLDQHLDAILRDDFCEGDDCFFAGGPLDAPARIPAGAMEHKGGSARGWPIEACRDYVIGPALAGMQVIPEVYNL